MSLASDSSQSAIVLLGELPALSTDCACPTPPPACGETPAARLGRYVRAAELYEAPLADGWSLWCNPLAGGAPAVLNQAAVDRLAAFEAPQGLAGQADAQLLAARLLVLEGHSLAPPGEQQDTLTAWLHVTNACNLECPYCYVRKSGERMDLATGKRAVDALLATARLHGFRALKLKFAGGEASLHYRMVRQLHTYAVARAAAEGIALHAVVLSNGTVMPRAFADWLAASDVRLMLSVDGVGADHDQQRPWKGGGEGAFAAVERNLRERLLPRGIQPNVCITITGRNAERAADAVGWALDYDLPFMLNFYRENEQAAPHWALRFEEQQIIAGLRAAYARIEARLPDRPLLDGLLDRVQAQAHGHTCGAGRTYVVISHTGAVAQCQMHLDDARALPLGGDLISLVASGPLRNPHVDEKEGCRDCQWRYRCTGGCPIVTLRATGRTDVRSPNCNIYRSLYPAALRLEGLRILKVASQVA